MKSLKILIAEDHKVVIMGTVQMLQKLVSRRQNCWCHGFVGDLDQLRTETFDLLIPDINIPGGDRPAMIQEIRKIQPDIKILIFSGYDETLYAYPSVKVNFHVSVVF